MDTQQILVGNLQEALRQLQKYLATGLATALSLLLLTWGQSSSSTQGAVTIPGLPVAVAASLLEILLIAVFMATGWLCYSSSLDARKIAARISNVEVRSAALSFPTVISSQDHGMRKVAALLPAIIYTVYLVSDVYRSTAPAFNKYWLLFLFGVMPFVGVMIATRSPLDKADAKGE